MNYFFQLDEKLGGSFFGILFIIFVELKILDEDILLDLYEVVRREKKFKVRIQEFVEILEIFFKNLEMRYQQIVEYVVDLKKVNGVFVVVYEKVKKKYGVRLRKLE